MLHARFNAFYPKCIFSLSVLVFLPSDLSISSESVSVYQAESIFLSFFPLIKIHLSKLGTCLPKLEQTKTPYRQLFQTNLKTKQLYKPRSEKMYSMCDLNVLFYTKQKILFRKLFRAIMELRVIIFSSSLRGMVRDLLAKLEKL